MRSCSGESSTPDPPDPKKAQASAKLFLSPSVNAAAVAVEFLKGPFGNEQDMGALVDCLSGSVKDVWAGDLRRAEAMLYGQATALQAIFTNLARRANSQEYLKHMETFMRLALKAQSQCRATLETLATIKAGPAIFARQANIAHGPQQVNNGVSGPARAGARAGEMAIAKTELLGVSDGERLDTGAASAPSRGNPVLETVDEIDGAAHARGKARAKMNGYRGGHWRELRELSKAMNALLRGQRQRLDVLHYLASDDKEVSVSFTDNNTSRNRL